MKKKKHKSVTYKNQTICVGEFYVRKKEWPKEIIDISYNKRYLPYIIVHKMINGRIDRSSPATFLQEHKKITREEFRKAKKNYKEYMANTSKDIKEIKRIQKFSAEEFLKEKGWKVGDVIESPTGVLVEILSLYKDCLIFRCDNGEESFCNFSSFFKHTKTSKKIHFDPKKKSLSVFALEENGVQEKDYIVIETDLIKQKVFQVIFIGKTFAFARAFPEHCVSGFNIYNFNWERKGDIKAFKTLEEVVEFLSRKNRELKEEIQNRRP